MSLNWKEIDKIISEWKLINGKIQQVLQPNPHELYLEIYSPNLKNDTENSISSTVPKINILKIYLENRAVRIHTSLSKIKKPKVPQRFQQFLQARIIGARIENIEHLNKNRIIKFTLITKHELHTICFLYVKLWSNQANIILTNNENIILDLAFRRPKQLLIPGEILELKDNDTNYKKSDTEIRAYNNVSFNQFIEQSYTQSKLENKNETEISKIEIALKKHNSILAQKINTLTKLQKQYELHKDYELYGNLILSNSTLIPDNSKSITLNTTFEEILNKEIIIPLNPEINAIENAQYYFNLAKKSKNKKEHIVLLSLQIKESKQNIEIIEKLLQQNSTDLPQNIKDWLFKKNEQKSPIIQSSKSDKQNIKIKFQDGDFLIMVGRNQKENDNLLRYHVKGSDTWLHSRGYAGAYVFIRTLKNKTIPLTKLILYAQLAALYSKAKNESYIDVYYTQVKYLKRVKKTPGLVIPIRDKNLQVKVNIDLIKKYLKKFDL